MPTTFDSGTLQAGTGITSPVVNGDQTAYDGFYFVAIDANGASVPIISSSYNAGTNKTTLTISTISAIAAGQAYEISAWPGGTAGRLRSGDTVPVVYKPADARPLWQIGPKIFMYERDDNTVYIASKAGSGANGDHLRDLRVADLGADAIEINGTFGDTSPGGYESAYTSGILLYNGANIRAYRDQSNNPRSKSFSLEADTGQTTLWAVPRTGSGQTNSPKYRTIGTYWNGSASVDKVGYWQVLPTSSAGAASLDIGFEGAASPGIQTYADLTTALNGNVGIGKIGTSATQLVIASDQANTTAHPYLTFRNLGAGYGSWEFTKMSSNDLALKSGALDSDNPNTNTVVYYKYGVGVGFGGNTNPTTAVDVTGTVTATLFAGSGASLTSIPQSGVTSLTSDLALKAPLASPTFTGTVTVPTPSGASDAATKAYVDAISVGIDWKPSVRVATTVAGTLATSFENGDVVDGVTLATGDRILIKDQASGAENGIYVVAASGAPARASDADTSTEVTGGLAVWVNEGTTNADTGWVVTTNDTITLGSTAIVFSQILRTRASNGRGWTYQIRQYPHCGSRNGHYGKC
jgi:hypothetical protein